MSPCLRFTNQIMSWFVCCELQLLAFLVAWKHFFSPELWVKCLTDRTFSTTFSPLHSQRSSAEECPGLRFLSAPKHLLSYCRLPELWRSPTCVCMCVCADPHPWHRLEWVSFVFAMNTFKEEEGEEKKGEEEESDTVPEEASQKATDSNIPLVSSTGATFRRVCEPTPKAPSKWRKRNW